MSNKIILTVICIMISFFGKSWAANQSDSTVVKDSTTVQSTTPTTPVVGITIPEGTKLMVNINTPINTAKNPAGSTFTSILEVDFVFDGKIISPKGSHVNGKVIESQGGKEAGGAKLTFQFTDIMVNNQLTPIVTDPISVEGGRKRKDSIEVSAGTIEEVPLKAPLVIK